MMPRKRLLVSSLTVAALVAGGSALALYPDSRERQINAVQQQIDANEKGAPQPGAQGISITESTLIDVSSNEVSQHGNITVPRVGMDLPIYEQPFEPTLVPGDAQHAWAVVDEDQGWYWSEQATKLIIMHSSPYHQDTPGNPLTNEGRPTLSPGDEIIVDGQSYTVQSDMVVPKSGLNGLDIWRNVPGQLIVVTCYPMDGKKSSPANVVFIAQKTMA